MARPQKHFIDRLAIIAAVARLEAHWLADAESQIAPLQARYDAAPRPKPTRVFTEIQNLRRYQDDLRRDGICYDLPAIVGRPLTASESVLYRREMRAMEADGLLALYPPHKAAFVRVTDAGRAAIAQAAQADAPASVNDISPAQAPDAPANDYAI